MAVLKMQKINLCAMKKNRKRILEAVQAMGVVEVSSWQDEMEGFQKMDTSAQKSQFEKTAAIIDQALEILEKYAPEKKGMFYIQLQLVHLIICHFFSNRIQCFH